MSHVPLGPGPEFDAIRVVLARLGVTARDIGDDAAVLDVPQGERIVISTDTSVEHVHFERAWLTAEEIGWRATMAALSDLAAMGASPMGVLTALTVPPTWRAALPAIADGIASACAHAGCRVIGGDMSAGGELSLGVTVVGSARASIARSGARPGDTVWVTGTLGAPALALRAWRAGDEPTHEARARFAHPIARIAAGLWFAKNGASAAIDISDGLIADARHVAAASGVALAISLDTVPSAPGVTATDAASSGEEYELLVCGPESFDAREFQRASGVSLTRIGSVVAGAPGVSVTQAGVRVEFGGGHDHFSA